MNVKIVEFALVRERNLIQISEAVAHFGHTVSMLDHSPKVIKK